jgi:hypothetical protein
MVAVMAIEGSVEVGRCRSGAPETRLGKVLASSLTLLVSSSATFFYFFFYSYRRSFADRPGEASA